MNKKYYVANWKMTMPYQKVSAFMNEHADDLAALSHDATIIICPSYESLCVVSAASSRYGFYTGGQTCSQHVLGAYTGQVSAQSLKEVGCRYVLIGHTECRSAFHETNEIIAQKVLRALEQSIVPIICLGESAQEHQNGSTQQSLMAQLGPVDAAVKSVSYHGQLIFAYEPIWAIGTGKTPSMRDLEETCTALKAYLCQAFDQNTIALLYGGSVTDSNAAEIKTIAALDGLLIGGASSDFQKFKKIVS